MSSDAKIGLIVGLVFIFVIAFLINGLPSFRQDKNNNELTTNMVSLENEPAALGAKERKARETVEWTENLNQLEPKDQQPVISEAPTPQESIVDQTQDIRYKTLLPENPLIAEQTPSAKSVEEIKPVTPTITLDKQPADKQPAPVVVKTGWPKTYTVSAGDNLAIIAQKLYGTQQGSKKSNIMMIFEANRNVLKSPDAIYAGQKLIIPALLSVSTDTKIIESIFPKDKFEKVDTIGRQRISASSANEVKPKTDREYAVQDGDNLWKIAAEQLGDGKRYKEISKLNPDILKDEDSLAVGMRLKLPMR